MKKYTLYISLIFFFSHIAWSLDTRKDYADLPSNLYFPDDLPSNLYFPDDLPSKLYAQADRIIPTSYKHYCHHRGSLTSVPISSLNSDETAACKALKMKPGEAFPLKHTCLDKNGNISKIVYSTLSKEEACGEKTTFYLIKALAELMKKDNPRNFSEKNCKYEKNPERCMADLQANLAKLYSNLQEIHQIPTEPTPVCIADREDWMSYNIYHEVSCPEGAVPECRTLTGPMDYKVYCISIKIRSIDVVLPDEPVCPVNDQISRPAHITYVPKCILR